MYVKKNNGYGFRAYHADLWCNDTAKLLKLISLSTHANEVLQKALVSSNMVASKLEPFEVCLLFDANSPLLGLFRIVSDVIAEQEDIQLVATSDHADSDFVILAEYFKKDAAVDWERLDMVFYTYLSMVSDKIHSPSYVSWDECVDNEASNFGLNCYNCILLLDACIANGVLAADPNNKNRVLVYRQGTDTTPEGWYSDNIMLLASDLVQDKEGQKILLDALQKQNVTYVETDY